MGTFVLGNTTRSASFWDKVPLAVKTESGEWATFPLEVKFRRWTRSQLDAWMARRKEAEEASGGVTSVADQVNGILDYLEDWKAVTPEGATAELTSATLTALLDEFPGAGREILEKFISSTYGNREKN